MKTTELSPVSVIINASSKKLAEIVCAAIVLCLMLVWHFSPQTLGYVTLPLQFRIDNVKLTDLEVEISGLRTCSCWAGGYVQFADSPVPIYQISTRYRFGLYNGSNRVIAIGGEEWSTIRLLVAYPKSRKWTTVAVPNNLNWNDEYPQSPSKRNSIADGNEVWNNPGFRTTTPSLVENGADFGIPTGYELLAISSSPVWSTARYTSGTWTHATYIDEDSTSLLPTHGYDDTRSGFSSWSFQLPVGEALGQALERDASYEPSQEEVRQSFIVIGVAILVPDETGNTQLLGFAPTMYPGNEGSDDF